MAAISRVPMEVFQLDRLAANPNPIIQKIREAASGHRGGVILRVGKTRGLGSNLVGVRCRLGD